MGQFLLLSYYKTIVDSGGIEYDVLFTREYQHWLWVSPRSILIFSGEYRIKTNAFLVNNYLLLTHHERDESGGHCRQPKMSYNSLCSRLNNYSSCMFVLSKTWCARLDTHVFGRRNDKRSLYISLKREKLSSLWIYAVYLQHPFCACRLSFVLFHNNYMIFLGNEHMAVDLLSSSALGHWILLRRLPPCDVFTPQLPHRILRLLERVASYFLPQS